MDLKKAGIIGCGMVGSTTAFALMESGVFTDIVLIDKNKQKAEGEAMDLSHCRPYIKPVDIRAGDYPDLKDCGIIIVTAGVAQAPGETRLDCVKRNAAVFRSVIPEIVKYNKNAFLLIVTNPVDIMSYVAYKLSGYPAERVFGSGTVLDTARLRYIIGERLCIDPRSVHAFVIGEHGDSELCVWSSANISGVALKKYCDDNGCVAKSEQSRNEIENAVKNSAYEIIAQKGATYYGIAAATRKISESLVRDEHSVMPVSTLVNGHYGLDDVYISVPSIVGAKGVEGILDIELAGDEREALRDSANMLKSVIKEIGLRN